MKETHKKNHNESEKRKMILNSKEKWLVLIDYEKLCVKHCTEKEVINELIKRYRVSKNTIYRLIEKFNREKTVGRKSCQGRKRKTSKREDIIIIKTIEKKILFSRRNCFRS